jgi:hypothetical protein
MAATRRSEFQTEVGRLVLPLALGDNHHLIRRQRPLKFERLIRRGSMLTDLVRYSCRNLEPDRSRLVQ